MVRFVENVPGLPAVTYYQVVNYIGAADSMRTVAMRLVDEGIAAADDAKRRPSYTSPIEWQQQQRISKSLLYFVRGAVLKSQGDPDGALVAFDQSLKIGGDQTEQNAYAMFIETLKIKSKDGKALDVARTAIKNGASNQSIVDSYRQLQKAAGKSDAEVSAELEVLQKQGSALLVERLSREMLNLNMIDGQFTSLEGKPVNISDWKGKVVILDYWATWCGPCRKSFPSMQKLYEKYKNHPNVQFAIVNVWERSDDRKKLVTDFLGENKDLKFPVFYDLTDAVVQKYGVTGIPTKFYLGKDGRIQFKEVGYLPEEQFIKDATEKIEVLLAQ